MWDTIITMIIVWGVLLLCARSVYRTFTGKKSGCGCSCSSGGCPGSQGCAGISDKMPTS